MANEIRRSRWKISRFRSAGFRFAGGRIAGPRNSSLISGGFGKGEMMKILMWTSCLMEYSPAAAVETLAQCGYRWKELDVYKHL